MLEYNEEELLYLSRQGCQYAYVLFYKNYYDYVKRSVCSLSRKVGMPIDEGEYVQAAMFALMKAIDNYREDKNASMKTYFFMVIRDTLKTKYRKQNLEYQRALKKAISLNQMYSLTGYEYTEVIADDKIRYRPDLKLAVHESIEQYQNQIKMNLSDLEEDIFCYRVKGISHEEAAKLLDVDIRAVYNASYRLQKKIRKLKLD